MKYSRHGNEGLSLANYMGKVKVSVIVPVYNVELYLRDCLNSILNQGFAEIEVIIIDDESNDNSLSIAKEYAASDSRVRVFEQKHSGLGAARNRGVALANGKYFLFVDSDDYIAPNLLSEAYEFAITHDCDLTMFGHYCLEMDGHLLPFLFKDSGVISTEARFWEIKGWWKSLCWNKLYLTSTFSNVKQEEGVIHEDEFVIHKYVSAAKKIGVMSGAYYFYRKRPGSIMDGLNEKARYDVLRAHVERIRYFVKRAELRRFLEIELENAKNSFFAISSSNDGVLKSKARRLFRSLHVIPLRWISRRKRKLALLFLKARIITPCLWDYSGKKAL